MNQELKYCAVYTRKSTEEGLDQDFNSLDAQREACYAYVTSQKAEGWVALKESYDDGGYSGGNIERPGLKKLLEDIKAGKISIIVVYKIDRLTRSLMDFARLVELFDQHKVTFVSVTQSFNTTTSMGRLTLNVLLSFAQFEREVTGERIRDKIAASKKKGIWMGGPVPLGYDLKDRSLHINEKESVLVRKIFDTYLKVRSVIKLIEILNRDGEKTRAGNNFSRGMLYTLLVNPIYVGKIKHKNLIYEGHHKPILTEEILSASRKLLADNAVEPRGCKKMQHKHLLRGLLFDAQGVVYSPVFTNKNGQRYRYYVHWDKIQKRKEIDKDLLRIPAQEIESLLESKVREWFADNVNLARLTARDHLADHELLEHLSTTIKKFSAEAVFETVSKVVVSRDVLEVQVSLSLLKKVLQDNCGLALTTKPGPDDVVSFEIPFAKAKSWHGAIVIRPPSKGTPEDIFDLPPHELRDLIRGIIWRDEHFKGMTIREIAKRDQRSDAFVGSMIRKSLEIA